MPQANLRARLQRTIKASKERVQAMQRPELCLLKQLRRGQFIVKRRRVEREEQQVKTRFEASSPAVGSCRKECCELLFQVAMQTREGMERSIKVSLASDVSQDEGWTCLSGGRAEGA